MGAWMRRRARARGALARVRWLSQGSSWPGAARRPRPQRPRGGCCSRPAAVLGCRRPGPWTAGRPMPAGRGHIAPRAWRPRPLVGGQSFEAAPAPRVGIARMPMLTPPQRLGVAGDAGRPAAAQGYALAASGPHQQGHRSRHDLLSKMRDTAVLLRLAMAPKWARGSPWKVCQRNCARSNTCSCA